MRVITCREFNSQKNIISLNYSKDKQLNFCCFCFFLTNFFKIEIKNVEIAKLRSNMERVRFGLHKIGRNI